MTLFIVLLGFFIIKGLFWLPFYFKQLRVYLLVNLFTTMLVAPLMTLLYHETEIDFTIVFAGMILLDSLMLFFLVQKNVWKAVPAAFLANTIAIIFFYLGNG